MEIRIQRPGRPIGRSEGRGRRPWEPKRLTARQRLILAVVATRPHVPRWKVAEKFNISSSRLSILTCSHLGQAFMKRVLEEDDCSADD